MNLTDALGQAALERDSLHLRELVLEILRTYPKLEHMPAPETQDLKARAIAAGLIELLSDRRGQTAPAWTTLEGSTEPFFLVAAAETMPRLRLLCENNAPSFLKKRNLYAPPNFLEFA